MIVAIIVAVAKDNVIGKGNDIPWYCPADLQYFKRTTIGSPVLMGRRTYESLKIKPLPGRQNIVVTRDKSLNYQDCDMVSSIDAGVTLAKTHSAKKLFVIGGADIYKQCLPFADELYMTEVDLQIDGDRYFPQIDLKEWSLSKQESFLADDKNPYNMQFKVFLRS